MANKRVLGVIPARGGSKGVPGKNIKDLAGKPLIAYSIEAAMKAKCLTDLIVSTDDEKIAEVAKKFGGKVPFLRPGELATDKALSIEAINHALIEMEKLTGAKYDYVVLLQPTTPFRTADDIDAAFAKLEEGNCDSVVSLVDVGANHPARMYEIKNDELVSIMDEGVTMKPRQELPPIYIRSGDVYMTKRDLALEKKSMMSGICRPITIPRERAVNIDGIQDFHMAEIYLKNLGAK
ncbi:MAG: acylneuraminate cytidylyltransferase family protein [Bacteriovoracaceae bacterium]